MLTFYNDEIKLILKIEGYAYPFSREYWDSNWLSISIQIFNINEHNIIYDNNDPSLLTTEILNLKEWFMKIKDNNLKLISNIDFTEPCISFEVENSLLKIKLKYNLNPLYEDDFDSTYEQSFIINEKGLEHIIKNLDIYYSKYPERRVN